MAYSYTIGDLRKLNKDLILADSMSLDEIKKMLKNGEPKCK